MNYKNGKMDVMLDFIKKSKQIRNSLAVYGLVQCVDACFAAEAEARFPWQYRDGFMGRGRYGRVYGGYGFSA
jgi:hypothetical protein